MDLMQEIVPMEDIWAEWALLNPDSPATLKGACCIIDISNFSWKLMKFATPHNIKMCLDRVHTLPVREFKFHVVKSSVLIHAAINLIWVFLPQSIKDSVSISLV